MLIYKGVKARKEKRKLALIPKTRIIDHAIYSGKGNGNDNDNSNGAGDSADAKQANVKQADPKQADPKETGAE